MHTAPVQTLEQGAQLRRRQAHHAVLDGRPLEPAGLQPLGHQTQPRKVGARPRLLNIQSSSKRTINNAPLIVASAEFDGASKLLIISFTRAYGTKSGASISLVGYAPIAFERRGGVSTLCSDIAGQRYSLAIVSRPPAVRGRSSARHRWKMQRDSR